MPFTPSKPAYDPATKTFTADEPVTDPNDTTYAVQVPDEADASGDSALSVYSEDSPLTAEESQEDPTNTAVPTISGTVASTNVLTATSGTWTKPAHQPAITYTYQWQSKVGSTYTNIGGATNNTYTVQAGDIGKKLRVVVTAHSGTTSNSANSADTITVPS